MTELAVWRGTTLIGRLSRARSGLRFSFDPGLLAATGFGRPIVSMSLPTSARGYGDRATRPFFDGLLPEGEARRIIAYDFGLAEADTFAMLSVIGRDCAGALALLAAHESPPPPRPANELRELTTDEIARLVASLRFHPLGVGDVLRASLGGVQEKLLLTRRDDGWAIPTTDVASTHILKPEVAGLADSATNEAVCLRFASLLGVPASTVTLDRFGDREVLVVERFDRWSDPAGRIMRSHQETACQALAIPVAAVPRKYEDSGGPSLRAIAGLLVRWSASSELEMLLRHTTVNMLIGNADAHAMNISFVLADTGEVTLAPLYDVFSTVAYPQISTSASMFVDGVRDVSTVNRRHLVAEGESWGIEADRSATIVEDLCTRAEGALEAALLTTDRVPDWLGESLRRRIERFAKS